MKWKRSTMMIDRRLTMIQGRGQWHWISVHLRRRHLLVRRSMVMNKCRCFLLTSTLLTSLPRCRQVYNLVRPGFYTSHLPLKILLTFRLSTRRQWSGSDSQVKSYANSQYLLNKKLVSQLSSIETSVRRNSSSCDILLTRFTGRMEPGQYQCQCRCLLRPLHGFRHQSRYVQRRK